MAKKPTSEPSEQQQTGEIPISFGGKGRSSNRGDRVSIITDRGTEYLAMYPSDPLLVHMNGWRFVTSSFLFEEDKITGIKLMKAERGYTIRNGKGSRPCLHLSLVDIHVTPVDGDVNEVGTFTGSIASDDVIKFTLPQVIRGKYKTFKLSRRS
jgi:hypothetical protein